MSNNALPFVIAALAIFLAHCTQAEDLSQGAADNGDGTGAPAAASTQTTDSAPAPPRVFAQALADSKPGDWSWYGDDQFDGKPECMDGSKTGLGINRSPNGSNKVLIFMMGGGACFDGQTCAIADYALSADHANGTIDFDKWKLTVGSSTIMNRGQAKNPFKDWNYVYVPYCSGDVFSGNTPSGFDGKPQVGFENVTAYLPRLQSTFRNADQVMLSGTSAGGYGAVYNYVQVQKSFDWLDVNVIDDSGPPLSPTYTTPCLQEKWKETWKMDTTSPVDGPFPLGIDQATGKPGGGLIALVQDIVTAHPKSKFAFLSHETDIVMRYFHGIGQTASCNSPGLMSADQFSAGLREVSSTLNMPNFSIYYGPGSSHMYFSTDSTYYGTTSDDNVALPDWLMKFATTGDEQKRVPANF